MESASISSANDALRASWVNSVGEYIRDSQGGSLDLTRRKLNTEELKLLLKYLPNSKLKELNLSSNDLTGGMEALAQVLVKTEIEKLDVSRCGLSKEDIFCLMEALKDSKLIVLSIEINRVGQFSAEERDKFISCLLTAKLNIFCFDIDIFSDVGHIPFFDALVKTKISDLCFSIDTQAVDIFNPLLSRFPQYSLNDLHLEDYTFNRETMKTLSRGIRNSTLTGLTLKYCTLTKCADNGVDILAKGLIHSRITHLDLSANRIHGLNTLGSRLKDMCLEVLILNSNPLDQPGIFLNPDFLRSSSIIKLELKHCYFKSNFFQKLIKSLKFSKVTELNLRCTIRPNCQLGLEDIIKFIKVLKDTNLETVNFSGNRLPGGGMIVFSEGINNSKLSRINLSDCFEDPNGLIISDFLSNIKSTSLTSLNLGDSKINQSGAETLAPHLANSKFIQLHLSGNPIGNGLSSLVERLRFTKFTILNVSSCKITDEGVKVLAKHLKETQLINIGLSKNEITNCGAEALAPVLRGSSLLYLDLSDNKIENKGIEALAQGAKNTFITTLDVSGNSEGSVHSYLYLDPVLLRNKVSVQRLVNTFKRIAPQVGTTSFCFTSNCNSDSVFVFLENCLELYKNIIIQKPSAVRVLLEETSIPFNKEQIISLMLEEFPNQFSIFVAGSVDADVKDHVGLLRKAEDWGLNKIVEFLLLNKPLYMIDESEGVLDPYVYLLLNKYNYPICNLDIESNGKLKIIDYFTKHRDVDEASDVIRLLHGKRKL